jgi:hypothetical protein
MSMRQFFYDWFTGKTIWVVFFNVILMNEKDEKSNLLLINHNQ